MKDLIHRWSEIESDRPIPLLSRQMVKGEQMLVANVHLETGCKVALHSHASEQIAVILSGRVRWGLGNADSADRVEFELGAGEVLHLPANLPHEVEALEPTRILDILSPPGPMGVDRQGS